MKADTLSAHRARIRESLEYIQDRLDEDLDLESLARRSGTSPFHFHRLFRELVGEPPRAYVRRLRLERAAVSLLYTRARVQRVAQRAGYESHEAFTRAFRGFFGRSPSAFREAVESARSSIAFEYSIERLPRRKLAFLPRVGPYDEIETGFRQLHEWAGPRGLAGAEPLGIYRDDQVVTPPSRTRYEAALLLDQDVTPEGEIRIRELPDRDYAVVRIDGIPSKQLLRPIYRELALHGLSGSGRRIANEPNFEVYGTGPYGPQTRLHVPLL